eukprot:Nk52_evm26s805 gene=Nk52_evmTU26s805
MPSDKGFASLLRAFNIGGDKAKHSKRQDNVSARKDENTKGKNVLHRSISEGCVSNSKEHLNEPRGAHVSKHGIYQTASLSQRMGGYNNKLSPVGSLGASCTCLSDNECGNLEEVEEGQIESSAERRTGKGSATTIGHGRETCVGPGKDMGRSNISSERMGGVEMCVSEASGGGNNLSVDNVSVASSQHNSNGSGVVTITISPTQSHSSSRPNSRNTSPSNSINLTLMNSSGKTSPNSSSQRGQSSIFSLSSSGSQNSNEILKIIVMGKEGVGKTSLIETLIDGQIPTNTLPTIEDIYVTAIETMEGNSVKVQIFDTAGTEPTPGIQQHYLNIAHGIIVLFSVNDLNSYAEAKKYIQLIHSQKGAEFPVVVVGTKADTISKTLFPPMNEGECLRGEDLDENRHISFEDAQSWCTKHAVGYCEVCSKENYNIAKPFLEIICSIHRRSLSKKGHIKKKSSFRDSVKHSLSK